MSRIYDMQVAGAEVCLSYVKGKGLQASVLLCDNEGPLVTSCYCGSNQAALDDLESKLRRFGGSGTLAQRVQRIRNRTRTR